MRTADEFWTRDCVCLSTCMHKKGKTLRLFLDRPVIYYFFNIQITFWCLRRSLSDLWVIFDCFAQGLRQITDPQRWGLNRGHCSLILFLSAFGCWLTGLVWLPETIILTSWNHRPASHPRHISGLLWINCINLMRIYWPALVTFDLCVLVSRTQLYI